MVDILKRVSPDMMKEAQEEDIDISKTIHYVNLARKQCLLKYNKLNQNMCMGISTSLIGWFSIKDYGTGSMSKMGPSTINPFY